MAQKKIYLVCSLDVDPHGGYRPIAAFKSADDANEFVKRLEEVDSNNYDVLWIDFYESLDEALKDRF